MAKNQISPNYGKISKEGLALINRGLSLVEILDTAIADKKRESEKLDSEALTASEKRARLTPYTVAVKDAKQALSDFEGLMCGKFSPVSAILTGETGRTAFSVEAFFRFSGILPETGEISKKGNDKIEALIVAMTARSELKRDRGSFVVKYKKDDPADFAVALKVGLASTGAFVTTEYSIAVRDFEAEKDA